MLSEQLIASGGPEVLGVHNKSKIDISCAITHFGASVQSNYPEHPIQIQRFHMEGVKSKINTMF
jgi:hypothetical protein